MRLSEAIRLGAMLKPQGIAAMLSDGHTCALGAALDAIGTSEKKMTGISARRAWPETLNIFCECPSCGYADDIYFVIGQHLNDEHRWTRERIADWVETLEAAQAPCEPASCDAVREADAQPVVGPRA